MDFKLTDDIDLKAGESLEVDNVGVTTILQAFHTDSEERDYIHDILDSAYYKLEQARDTKSLDDIAMQTINKLKPFFKKIEYDIIDRQIHINITSKNNESRVLTL